MPISLGVIDIASNQPNRFPSDPAAQAIALAAPLENTATVYMGTHGVTPQNGFPLAPGDSVSLSGASGLSDIWIIGAVGDSLRWICAV